MVINNAQNATSQSLIELALGRGYTEVKEAAFKEKMVVTLSVFT